MDDFELAGFARKTFKTLTQSLAGAANSVLCNNLIVQLLNILDITLKPGGQNVTDSFVFTFFRGGFFRNRNRRLLYLYCKSSER